MDGSRFDRLTRDWSRGSRRAVVRGGIGAALGALVGRDAAPSAAASGCTPYQATCATSEECCSGLCIIGACAGLSNGLDCKTDGACASGLCFKRKKRLKKGVCAACSGDDCAAGYRCVDGVCQIVSSCTSSEDCPAGHGCRDGQCVATCRKNRDCSSGRCVRSSAGRFCEQGCESDGDCANNQYCGGGACVTCPSGQLGCGGKCLDLSVCPDDEKHTTCNNSGGCICTRIADNNNTRFCAVSTDCNTPCGPNNSCPTGQSCVMTCCDGAGNAGLRCLPSCG